MNPYFIINPNITGTWIEQPDVHKNYAIVFDILQIFSHLKMITLGSSLVVQWLRLRASNAGDTGSIPGWGTLILHGVAKKKR